MDGLIFLLFKKNTIHYFSWKMEVDKDLCLQFMH